MSERRTAQIVGAVLGLIFAAALILNALAAYSAITPSNHRMIADPYRPVHPSYWFLKRVNKTCEKCKQRVTVEVHHMAYVRVLTKARADLIARDPLAATGERQPSAISFDLPTAPET
jgi:hypothetical protein